MKTNAQVDVRLLGVRADANGFGIGLDGLFRMARVLVGYAEIVPAVEILGSILNQLGAKLASGFKVIIGEGAGREPLNRSLRSRPQSQELLGIVADHGAVFTG